MTSDFVLLDHIAGRIGLPAAMRLVGWSGGRRQRVPTTADPASPLAKVLGARELAALVDAAGGQTLRVPDVVEELQALRMAGKVVRLVEGGTHQAEVARLLNLGRSRVNEILYQFGEMKNG